MALVNYDNDDWEMPAHQRRALLQLFQIDTTIDDEFQAKSYWVESIKDDEDHWEDILKREIKREADQKQEAIKQAIRTVREVPKRKVRLKNKSYMKALEEYNAALKLLREEGYDITHIITGGNE